MQSDQEADSKTRYGKRMGKQFAAFADKINEASGMDLS